MPNKFPALQIYGDLNKMGDGIFDRMSGIEGTTLWYHDHALGVTRLNVYAGLAGFYFLRENNESTLGLPNGPQEMEIVIQDRMFTTDGQLYYPTVPPNPSIHPYWTPEFFGDVIVVNGKACPYLEVEPRRYRFRLLNGSNARVYDMWIEEGISMWQIGTDGGFLDEPIEVNPRKNGARSLLLSPGERADVIVDFSGQPGNRVKLLTLARAPYPMGDSPDGTPVREILEFRVLQKNTGNAKDGSFDPSSAKSLALRRGKPLVKLANFQSGQPAVPVDLTRQLTLNEMMGPGGPLAVLLNNTMWDPETKEKPHGR